jgi:hypothetical protein
MHHVRWRELTAAEHDAAVTALRDLATGRALLLAEVAGILERASEVCRQAAQLCRDAGAGREAIPAWMEEGRSRRALASVLPFSGRYARQRSRQPPIPSPRASVLVNLSVNVEPLDVIAEPMHSSLL